MVSQKASFDPDSTLGANFMCFHSLNNNIHEASCMCSEHTGLDKAVLDPIPGLPKLENIKEINIEL